MLVSKTVDLKKVISQIVNEDKDAKLPQVITFSKGIEFSKFKITIEEIHEYFFIDSKGFKWVKTKEVHKDQQ